MKCVIITSNNLRHKAFAKMLCENFDVRMIIYQQKEYESEKDFQKESHWFEGCLSWMSPVSNVTCLSGDINGESYASLIKLVKPDFILTFGCDLLKENIYNIAKKGTINIHTGIVQSYRGVDSSLWAIYEENPEGIGATLHYVDNSIDAGDIIAQKKADLKVDYDLYDVFLSSCVAGFELLKESLPLLESGEISAYKLKDKGRLFQKKDKNEDVVRVAKSKLKKVLGAYLND
jgi:methionyl-tRNA formyltransferase